LGIPGLPGAQPVPGMPVNPVPAQAPQGRSFTQVSPTTSYMRSPYRAVSQNELLLDSIGLRLVLAFDYRKGVETEAQWKLRGLPGVKSARYFMKSLADGSTRYVEIGISSNPQGGYDLLLYSTQNQAATPGPNPEFSDLQSLVQQDVARLEQEPAQLDLRQLSYEVYNLSYVDADRAIAVLKTLGYTTVEY